MYSEYFIQQGQNKTVSSFDVYPELFLSVCVWATFNTCLFSAWLEGEEDPVIDRVNQRIEDITGLTVETAELLQVMEFISHI